jgi:hypothetical protein
MKSAWIIAVAAMLVLPACKGGENAERAGANIEGSEAEVTAPQGGELPDRETNYSPRSETDYNPRSETDYNS